MNQVTSVATVGLIYSNNFDLKELFFLEERDTAQSAKSTYQDL